MFFFCRNVACIAYIKHSNAPVNTRSGAWRSVGTRYSIRSFKPVWQNNIPVNFFKSIRFYIYSHNLRQFLNLTLLCSFYMCWTTCVVEFYTNIWDFSLIHFFLFRIWIIFLNHFLYIFSFKPRMIISNRAQNLWGLQYKLYRPTFHINIKKKLECTYFAIELLKYENEKSMKAAGYKYLSDIFLSKHNTIL